jgi:hypothetical protein
MFSAKGLCREVGDGWVGAVVVASLRTLVIPAFAGMTNPEIFQSSKSVSCARGALLRAVRTKVSTLKQRADEQV